VIELDRPHLREPIHRLLDEVAAAHGGSDGTLGDGGLVDLVRTSYGDDPGDALASHFPLTLQRDAPTGVGRFRSTGRAFELPTSQFTVRVPSPLAATYVATADELTLTFVAGAAVVVEKRIFGIPIAVEVRSLRFTRRDAFVDVGAEAYNLRVTWQPPDPS